MLKLCSLSKNIDEESIRKLNEKSIEVEIWKKENYPNKKELKQLINEYDILIIGVEERITKDMIQDIKTRKLLASLSIGLDHIDRECFSSPNIDIVSCPNANVVSVAEHIFTLILDASKRMKEASELVENKILNRKQLSSKPVEISGKTLGCIGAGKITQKVVDIALAFHMSILCYTIHPDRHKDLIDKKVKFVSLEEIIKNADIINVSVPLTNTTKNLLSEERIKLLKKNAIFISTSRSDVLDIKALLKRADENPSFYVGLDMDMFEYKELLQKKRNNVVITPHLAGYTNEAIKRQYNECAENIIRVLENKK